MEQTIQPMKSSSPYAGGVSAFAFGPFRLHLPERSLQRHGVPAPLGGRAFDILACLVQHAGQVVRHDELIAHVWADVRVSPGTLRVHLAALRKVLGCRPDHIRYIANIPGRGYCFVAPGVTAVAMEQGKGGCTHRVPSIVNLPAEAPVGSQLRWLPQSGSVRGPSQVKLGLPDQQMALNVAEQLLATARTTGNLLTFAKGCGELAQRSGCSRQQWR